MSGSFRGGGDTFFLYKFSEFKLWGHFSEAREFHRRGLVYWLNCCWRKVYAQDIVTAIDYRELERRGYVVV